MVYWEKKRRYIKNKRGKEIPFGLIASAAAPTLGEVAKPLLKNFLVVGIEKDKDERENNTWLPCCSQTS